jgi:hypothetical protein
MTAANTSQKRARSAALNAPCAVKLSRIGTPLGYLDIASSPVQLRRPNDNSPQTPGVSQFDCGRVPGWKTSGLRRIFREWRQSSNAIAAPSTNAPKQSSWYRTPATHPVKSAGLRWSLGQKAPTLPHSSWSNVQTEGLVEVDCGSLPGWKRARRGAYSAR